MDIRLIVPHETRTVVGQLPGWPVSAAALFDRLNARITRDHLLRIADIDPFGASRHFPAMARIRVSARVPPHLGFHPGEALRLVRWGTPGSTSEHLERAWCCALLAIAPWNYQDELSSVAPPLVESCLALGEDAPELAEQLLAWRAITMDPDLAAHRSDDDNGYIDPVALLALLLLRMAADPTDARLPVLARAAAAAFTAPNADELLHLTGSGTPWGDRTEKRWAHLIDTILVPPCATDANLARLVAALRR